MTHTAVLEAVGSRLLHIKMEDGLTWADIEEAIGIGETQARKYLSGEATMSIHTYAKGWAAWGTRFTGGLHLLVEGIDGTDPCPHETQSALLKACVAIEEARDTDNDISLADVRKHRTTLERARDMIDEQLHRLGPKGATA